MTVGPEGADAVLRLMHRAAETVMGGPEAIANAAQRGFVVLERLAAATTKADALTEFALLPLCLCLLIVGEHARSVAESGPFRVQYVVARAAIVVALVLAYSNVCSLITSIAGAGGSWMSVDGLLSGLSDSKGAVGDAWTRMNGLSDVPEFAIVLLVSFVLICSALGAYIVGILLSTSQAAILALLLLVGKTCIVVSLIPGVTLGKSWARSLAQVAAWSSVAAVVTSLLSGHSIAIRALIAEGQIVPMLRASAQFVVLALCMLSVPIITARLFSGAAPAAVGAMGALMMGVAATRVFTRQVVGVPTRGPDGSLKGGNEGYQQRGGERFHKRPPAEASPARSPVSGTLILRNNLGTWTDKFPKSE